MPTLDYSTGRPNPKTPDPPKRGTEWGCLIPGGLLIAASIVGQALHDGPLDLDEGTGAVLGWICTFWVGVMLFAGVLLVLLRGRRNKK